MADPAPFRPVRHYRMYSDSSGESRLETVEVGQSLVDAAPPAPPLHLSAFGPASRCGFYSAQPGWSGDWHPAPTRQYMVLLSGEVDVETSDGGSLRLRPGDVILVEDTWGKGHRSMSVGALGFHFFVTQVPAA